jgi:hypothetical protein
MLLAPGSTVISGPNPARLITTFYCLRSESPQPGGPDPPVFVSPRNRVAQLYHHSTLKNILLIRESKNKLYSIHIKRTLWLDDHVLVAELSVPESDCSMNCILAIKCGERYCFA